MMNRKDASVIACGHADANGRRHGTQRFRWCENPFSHSRRAFTLVEMIVVIAIIVLILAIAVPALNNMTGDARFDSAVQTMNGVLSRAYLTSQSDMQLIAVRLMPGAWDHKEEQDPQTAARRQHIGVYGWVAQADREQPGANPPFQMQFRERFERRANTESIELPADIWIAPIEGWREAPGQTAPGPAQSTLEGDIGKFALDASLRTNRFFSADDFLIVFDPKTGVQATRTLYPMYAYDAGTAPNTGERDRDELNGERFQRYSSPGLIVYRREPFLQLGRQPPPPEWVERSRLLRDLGRPYFVHRFGGGLVLGRQESP